MNADVRATRIRGCDSTRRAGDHDEGRTDALLAFVLAALLSLPAVAARAGPGAPLTLPDCVDQLRHSSSDWIRCRGVFEADEAGRAELSAATFDTIKGATCLADIRVRRSELIEARRTGRVLALPPHRMQCRFETGDAALPEVGVVLAPRISFEGGRVVDVSPQILEIDALPDLLATPLTTLMETDRVRRRLARELDADLQQAFSK